MEFVRAVVRDHIGSAEYKIAVVAEEYYSKRNPTIERFQKMLYTATGRAYPDLYSSNFKLKTLFFRRFVIQQTEYVLSNGASFGKTKTKEKLGGANFDIQLLTAAKKAMVDGVSFGFWNKDHLEVFGFADTCNSPGFAPIYDTETDALMAGVRYWTVADGDAWRYTLYEPDGLTEYIRRKSEDMVELEPKRAYVRSVKTDGIVGDVVEGGVNYSALPIIPMYANDLRQSELVGIQESIDCYDFIKSGLANVIEDNSSVFWTLRGAAGMDDVDIAQFMDRLKTLHAAPAGDGEEGDAVPHTLDIPYQARETMLDRLRGDLYEDFQLVDTEKMMSGNLTATAIRMGYQMQDDKCGDFEYHIREFISKLLALIGLDDEPTFRWNRIANQLEETQMVLLAANYLDDEAVLAHLPWILPEEADELLKRRAAEEIGGTLAGVNGVEE